MMASGKFSAFIFLSSEQLSALDDNIFAIITKLKRQAKRDGIDNVHVQIIKTVDLKRSFKETFKKKSTILFLW